MAPRPRSPTAFLAAALVAILAASAAAFFLRSADATQFITNTAAYGRNNSCFDVFYNETTFPDVLSYVGLPSVYDGNAAP
jgi:hypothetical protein